MVPEPGALQRLSRSTRPQRWPRPCSVNSGKWQLTVSRGMPAINSRNSTAKLGGCGFLRARRQRALSKIKSLASRNERSGSGSVRIFRRLRFHGPKHNQETECSSRRNAVDELGEYQKSPLGSFLSASLRSFSASFSMSSPSSSSAGLLLAAGFASSPPLQSSPSVKTFTTLPAAAG